MFTKHLEIQKSWKIVEILETLWDILLLLIPHNVLWLQKNVFCNQIFNFEVSVVLLVLVVEYFVIFSGNFLIWQLQLSWVKIFYLCYCQL